MHLLQIHLYFRHTVYERVRETLNRPRGRNLPYKGEVILS